MPLFLRCPVYSTLGFSSRVGFSACFPPRSWMPHWPTRMPTASRATMPSASLCFLRRIFFHFSGHYKRSSTTGQDLRNGPRTIGPLREIPAARFRLPLRLYKWHAWALLRACHFFPPHSLLATATYPIASTVSSASRQARRPALVITKFCFEWGGFCLPLASQPC